MAQTVVELSGDESKLLQSFRRMVDEQAKIEAKFSAMGDASNAAESEISGSMESAGRASARAWNEPLRELRKLGPEGREMAAAVEGHLRETGQGGRQSMESILAKLHELDPESARVAQKMQGEFSSTAQKAGVSWERWTQNTLSNIASVVLTYASVGRAVQEVTGFLTEQQQVLEQSLDAQTRLAVAQQQAAKNLAGLSVVERSDLLTRSVPEIARDTGFSDVGQITTALGTASSSGANAQQAAEAVRHSARVELLTPDSLDETAAGAVAIQRQTGLEDIRQSIALLQTAGTQAAVTDPNKLISSLPRALTAISSLPGQDKEDAARQIAAVFGEVTKAGNDTQGASSATFVTKFAGELNSFFGDLEKQARDARSELQTTEGKKTITEKDLFRIDELKKLIPQLETATDPQTLFGRVEALQKNEILRNEFVGEGFGEEQFQGFLKNVFDASSVSAQGLKSSFDAIRADASFFESEAAKISAGTPQLAIASSVQRSAAGIGSSQSFDIDAAALGAVREIFETTTTAARGGSLDDFIERTFRDPALRNGGLQGTTGLEESVSAIDEFQLRIRRLERDGIAPSEAPQIEKLRGGVAAIEQLVTSIGGRGIDPQSITSAISLARDRAVLAEETQPTRSESERQLRQENINTLNRIATILEEQLAASKQTAANTAPQTPDLSAAQQSAAQ